MSKTQEIPQENKTTFTKGDLLYNSILVAPCNPTEKYMHLFAGCEGEAIQLHPDTLKGFIVKFTDIITYVLHKTDVKTGETTQGLFIRLYDRETKQAYYTISAGLTMAIKQLLDSAGAPILNNSRLCIILDHKAFTDKAGQPQRTYKFNIVSCEPFAEVLPEDNTPKLAEAEIAKIEEKSIEPEYTARTDEEAPTE